MTIKQREGTQIAKPGMKEGIITTTPQHTIKDYKEMLQATQFSNLDIMDGPIIYQKLQTTQTHQR